MAISKIILNGVTQMDLTSDTVQASNLIAPNTAHGADGEAIVGIASAASEPNLQAKTNISPTTSSQTITADSGYDGLSSVQINSIPSQYVVPSGSQTVQSNGTYDVTSLAEMIINVSSGGSSIKSGTITPDSAATTMSFDIGLSSINGLLIVPLESPFIGSRTQIGLISFPNGTYWKSISLFTNQGGTGWINPSGSTTSSRVSISGTIATVTGSYNWRQIQYQWFAW